ncbi:Rod shape-determining protein MreC [Dissulfuribacter thermophilus]|uniref:Cell shape-determining protein MreC n=1 Tax=Dissulfuribacter thermophilus TaxID=1156395 RepID=A0A1B9F718_9BACT|nr:rod shape-determining protein MreC [Dissulfuribacter thermophilus]OCC15690.1 Rod shape-determining protein MreC [Dissulfuribacter thermophilus]
MTEKKRSLRQFKFVIGAIVLIGIFVILARMNHDFYTLISNLVLEPTGPVKERLNGPSTYLHELFRDLSSFNRLRTENRKLRIEIAELRRQLNMYREASLENVRLKSLLRMKNSIQDDFLVCQVVGYDLTPWISIVTVNRGVNDGVFPDAVVLSGGGVAGRVLNSSLHYSRVMLISDRNSRIPALIQRTRVRGILEGLGEGRCQLSYVEKGADVIVGDKVITSGIGGYFPKGLLLGTVTKVDKDTEHDDLFQLIEVNPTSDLGRLEELLILKRKKAILGE